MTWILTAGARALDLRDPNPAHIHPFDIAWSLAQTNRFTGHARRPYSVAEHSLLVADIMARDMALDHYAQLAGLMHDAHEAYSGDAASPAKLAIGQAWRVFEDRLEWATRCAFGIHSLSSLHQAAVKRADMIALATERRDLLPTHGDGARPWVTLNGINPVAWADLASPERTAAGWEHWRDAWLDRYNALERQRNAKLFGGAPLAAGAATAAGTADASNTVTG